MSIWLDLIDTQIRTVSTPTYGDTRIIEAGTDNSKTLVFLHGVGGHAEAYCKNITSLSAEFHTIAYDYVGHGRSNLKQMEYTPHVLVDHLKELLDTLDIANVNLSGESLGGWVSGLFSSKYPERVERLMLNTAAGIPIVTDKGRADLQELIELTSKATTQGPPTSETVKQRMQWLFHPDNYNMITEELISTRLSHYSRQGMRDVAPRVMAMISLHDDYLIPLSDISCETLFLWTQNNPVHDVTSAEASVSKVASAKLYVMRSKAAHWPQYEAPEEFNSVTRSFFLNGLQSI